MAQRVVLVDDIDGSESEVESYQFAWEGVEYKIDLGTKNAKKLSDFLANYVAHAERLSPSPRTRTTRVSAAPAAGTDKAQLQAMREWARANGFEVSDRGRVSAAIREAYDAAH